MSLMLCIAVASYIAPRVVAAYRDHPAKTAIFLINMLLGWTVVGWIATFVWAYWDGPNVTPIAARGNRLRLGSLWLQSGDPRVDETSRGSGQP